jgi:hypothetical protein
MVKSESERDVSGDEGLSVVVYIDQDVENILVGLREGRLAPPLIIFSSALMRNAHPYPREDDNRNTKRMRRKQGKIKNKGAL